MAGNDNLAVRILISAQDNASKTFDAIRANGAKLAEGLAAAFALDLFKGAVDEAAKFEAQLDKVGAKGGYTTQEMEQLSKSAVEIGSKFGVSGTEAAAGLEILAAAGLKSSEAINTLPSVLALAQSEAVSMDTAASTVTDTISIMGLGFSDAGRVADVFAKGANLSTTSAVELGEAFKGAGGAASASHYSLEQTAAMMNVLAANGIRGSEAGTGLKNVLSLLLDPTSNARKELSKLGVNTSDVGVAMDALQKAGDGGKQAMLAFGSEAMPAVLALTKSGSAGIKTFETALLNSKGAAEETAQGIASNFEGAKKNLEAAFTNLKVALGTPILKPLTESFNTFSGTVASNIPTIVQSLTSLSELYGIKLARDAATFAQSMIAANAAKKAAQVATQSVVAAEQELVAAMAAGGTQTTRYQAAQQQLAAAMTQGGSATAQYATAQNQLLTTHQTTQLATARVSTAQAELNAAIAEGGVVTERYIAAQTQLNTAKQIAQGTTQRLITVQADLNAEIAASGMNSQRAIALQNELNIAQTNAAISEQRLAAAQTELNAALTAGGTQTQRYVTALAELNAAQTRAAATTAALETETAALASSTNVAAASATALSTAFNGAMSIFAGWTIGTMIGEWANQFDFIKRRGADMSETFVQATETARYFFSGEFLKADDGTYAAKMAEIHNSFEQIRFATTEAGKAALATSENQQQAAEVTKKATQEQAKAVEEFAKLQLEKLKETTAAIDAFYKLENDAIALNLKLKTESIKSTYDDKLAKEKAITEATITASNQEIANLEAAATKKKSLVNAVYQDAIEKSAAGSVQRAEYEKQYLEASQEIYQSLYNSYAQTVSNMISAAQSHRDKAIAYGEEILNAEERRHSGILELERIGMTDAQLKASKKKEIEKGISDYKKAMAEGDFEKAKEISTNTEKLILDLAKSEKTQTSEVSSAKRQYNEVIGQTEAATKALQASENQQAADLEANAQNQIAKMNDIKGKLNEISEALNQNFLLTIHVNEDAVFKASADIDALSRNEYVTVYVTTVQTNQNGGQIQAFADGGTPSFVRREGGLGGYGGGDKIPAMLEAGEWIIKKESVKKYGNGFMAKLNAGEIQDIPKFSTGGSVRYFDQPIGSTARLDGYLKAAQDDEEKYRNLVDSLTNEYNKIVSNGWADVPYLLNQPVKINDAKAKLEAAQKETAKMQKLYDEAAKKEADEEAKRKEAEKAAQAEKEKADADKKRADEQKQREAEKAAQEKKLADEKAKQAESVKTITPTATQNYSQPATKEPASITNPVTTAVKSESVKTVVSVTPTQSSSSYSSTNRSYDDVISEKQRAKDKEEQDIYKLKEEGFKLTGDEAGLETFRYEKEKKDLAGNAPALAQAESNYKAKLAQIEAKKKEKAQQDAEKEQQIRDREAEKKKQLIEKAQQETQRAEEKQRQEAQRAEQEKQRAEEKAQQERERAAEKQRQEAEKLAQERERAAEKAAQEKQRAEEKAQQERDRAAEKQRQNDEKTAQEAEKRQSQTDSLKDEVDGMNGNKLAIEKRRYEKQLKELSGNTEALVLARKVHAKKVAEINAEKQQAIQTKRNEAPQSTTLSMQVGTPEPQSSPLRTDTVIIKFESPTGRQASGSFARADVTSVVEILKEAAARGSMPTL